MMLSVADMKERFHHDCLLAMAILREAHPDWDHLKITRFVLDMVNEHRHSLRQSLN